MRNQRMNGQLDASTTVPPPDQPNGVFRLLTAGAFLAALSVAGLTACSDSTSDDPLPLTDSDSGVIVEDPPADDGLVEEPPADDGAVDDGAGDDGSMEEGG